MERKEKKCGGHSQVEHGRRAHCRAAILDFVAPGVPAVVLGGENYDQQRHAAGLLIGDCVLKRKSPNNFFSDL